MQRCREGETLRFGSFELKTSTGELFKFGVRIRLPDQSSRILLVLLRRPGELVTREELQNLLWAKGTCVDFDHGLNLAINRLRGALSDPPQLPRYIETLPRKGYRFIGTVEAAASPTSTAAPRVEPPVLPTIAAGAGILSTPVSAPSGYCWRIPVDD